MLFHKSEDERYERSLQERPGYIDFRGLLGSSGSPLWYEVRDRRCTTIGFFALQCLLARMFSSGEFVDSAYIDGPTWQSQSGQFRHEDFEMQEYD